MQKQSATDLRRKIGFASVEDIDQKIAALEHNMMTSTLSLKEEKQFLEEIKRLKSSKPLLSKYQALEQSASSLEDTSVGARRSSAVESFQAANSKYICFLIPFLFKFSEFKLVFVCSASESNAGRSAHEAAGAPHAEARGEPEVQGAFGKKASSNANSLHKCLLF